LNCIQNVSSFFDLNARERCIEFSVETTETTIPGWFDPEKLETILLNLLSNAFKYTPDNGKIRVIVDVLKASEIEDAKELTKENKHIRVKVADNGQGILPDELPYIFDKFYQTKLTETKKKSGTGIGLTLTKGLIEMKPGKIWVKSMPGSETTFTFIIPVNRNAFRDDELVQNTASYLEKNMAYEDVELQLRIH